MLGITEKYNKLKGSAYFTKFKASRRLSIYTFSVYLVTTFSLGYLGLLIGSPALILPFITSISYFTIWIVIEIVLAVTRDATIKTLYNSTKGFLSKKESNGGRQEIQGKNGSTVLGSEYSLEDISHMGFITSNDNSLISKKFHENLPTLVHQTNRENYTYWLQQHDIAHIARAVYNYSESPDNYVSFCIPSNLETLNERLIEYKNKVEQKNQKATFTSVLNLENHHWTTLVVSYNLNNKKFIAYYCDSFIAKLPRFGSQRSNIENANEIKNQLVTPLNKQANELNAQGNEEMSKDIKKTVQICNNKKNELVNVPINADSIVSALESALKIESNNIRNSTIKQQSDGYNCGIFALENANKITQKLSEGKSFDEIDKELSRYKFDLNKKRKEYTEVLMKDKKWKEDLESGLLCKLPLGTQISFSSALKKEKVSLCSIM
ncbi:hypothetical protein GOY13_00530 [Wolbachia endosymbiont of Cruorifilaria tuberocauda]|uniref:hypothetical protein n=1 Tax=Wolbachia endosymbiont of Cruorifilaria tuberocauda TaxID=1812111 RepID=UPI00158E5A6F|nr:hypothetical protein [Wolbachia endosymbiont of Cruorifilaria tuberocauda]QKX01461.1 hypothetical protein GOY13_00530 [Wolbachia endosymbiont of Cruorifilaria tuberocauda]